MISTELNAAKIAQARANLAEAGLADLVTILDGDARETLAACPARSGSSCWTAGRASTSPSSASSSPA